MLLRDFQSEEEAVWNLP